MKAIQWGVLCWAMVMPCYATSLYTDGLRLVTGVGGSKSMGNTLSIHREDGKDYVINAMYDSRPYDDSSYWSGRLEWWDRGAAWELEVIHHKLYLVNLPSGILDFSISDGYNLLTVNRAWHLAGTDACFRVGVGAVVAHPDITFSDRERYILKGLPGLRFAGPTVQVGLENRFGMTKNHYINTELKLTASYAKTAISGNPSEYVVAPDVAVHLTIGVGSHPPTGASWVDWGLFSIPAFFPYTTGKVLGWR